MKLSRLTIGCTMIVGAGLLAASVLSASEPTAAGAQSNRIPQVEHVVNCTLFDNQEAFIRFDAAYRKIKMETGRDPSVRTALAAAGLNQPFCTEG